MKFREIKTIIFYDEPLMFMVEHIAGDVSDRIINREEFLQLTNEEKAKYFIEKYRDISLRLAPRQDPINYYYLANKISDEDYLLAPLSRRFIKLITEGRYTMKEIFSNNPYGWCVIATYVRNELTKKRTVPCSKLTSRELPLRSAEPPYGFIDYLTTLVGDKKLIGVKNEK